MTDDKELILSKLIDLKELIDEKFKVNVKEHVEIKTAQSYTNGKVASLVKWRLLMTGGGLVILFILTSILIPLSLSYAKEKINKDYISTNEVQRMINENNDKYFEQ
jgi:hypothetical protein